MNREELSIYLAGPMTGIPDDNRPAFKAATLELTTQGFLVVSPDELDDLYPVAGGSRKVPLWSDYMERDIPFLLRCDTVALLPGWRSSKGACLEALIANQLGKPVMEYQNGRLVHLRPDDLPQVVFNPTGT